LFEKVLERPGFWSVKGPNNDTVISSRIRLARNIRSLSFPGRFDQGDSEYVSLVTGKFLAESCFRDSLVHIDLAGVDDSEKRLLRERNLITLEMEVSPWSSVIISNTDDFSILINEEDHFRIQVIRSGLQLQEAYRTADRIDDELGRFMLYAFSDELGFLTACPSNAGTGLRSSVMVHLPALSMRKKIDGIIDDIREKGFDIRGTSGDSSKTVGDIYVISSRVSAGKSEIDIIETLDGLANSVIQVEDEERDGLMSRSRLDVEDAVWRSLGILLYSRKIHFMEAMEHLSAVRLGVVLAIIRNQDISVINDCMVNIQLSHLQKNSGRSFRDNIEADEARADYLKSVLSRGEHV